MNERRTLQQNKAMHKAFRLLSECLNDAGFDMKATLRHDVDIPWTPESVKIHLWKPVQEAYLDKESTTELSTTDVSAIYEILTRHLGQRLGIPIPPFPDRFSQSMENAE